MAKHKTESKPVAPTVQFDGDCDVTLPDWVRNDVNMLRRLHHKVVDLLADNDHITWMIQDVEDRLGALGRDVIRETVSDMIAEAANKGV